MDTPSPKAVSHLLTRAASSPFAAFAREDVAKSSAFLRGFLDQCDLLNFEDPAKALERGFVARELAQSVGDRHLLVRALALIGTGYRLESCSDKAKRLYEEAEAAAQGCHCCLPDIHHRRGWLVFYREAFTEAIDCFDKAIAIHEQHNQPDGIGRILVSRCVSLGELGRFEEALADNRLGLQLLSPNTPHSYFIAGLVNMIAIATGAIRSTGKIKMLEDALQAVYLFREHLQSHRLSYGFRRVRAVMRWTEGLICGSISGYKYRKRAMQALEIAANNFRSMGRMIEYTLVTADRAKLYLTNTRNDNSRRVTNIASRCLRDLTACDPSVLDDAILGKAIRVLQKLEENPSRAVVDELRETANFYMPSIDPNLVSISEMGVVG